MARKYYVPRDYVSFREWIHAQSKDRQEETAKAIGVHHNYLMQYMAAKYPPRRYTPTRKRIFDIMEASNGFLDLDSLVFYFYYEPLLTVLQEKSGISLSFKTMHRLDDSDFSNYELERLKNGEQ